MVCCYFYCCFCYNCCYYCHLLYIKVNPSKDYFAVAEKGKQPNILLYEYPSLRLYRVLKGKQDICVLNVHFLMFFLFPL